jgi:hypothetical protein
MPADVKELFTKSKLDPRRLNVFALILDQQGELVHAFYGLPASAYQTEIPKGLAKLKVPVTHVPGQSRPAVLPDLKAAAPGVPAGVRLFLRPQKMKPVVEAVAITAEQWKALSLPKQAKEVDVKALRNWLVQLYPPAIAAADERKPFQKITGSLELVPAGADQHARYALLRGKIRLAKGDDAESAFEGVLQAVVTYRPEAPEVQSFRGVVEGDYVYRGTERLPLRVAIESRPE